MLGQIVFCVKAWLVAWGACAWHAGECWGKQGDSWETHGSKPCIFLLSLSPRIAGAVSLEHPPRASLNCIQLQWLLMGIVHHSVSNANHSSHIPGLGSGHPQGLGELLLLQTYCWTLCYPSKNSDRVLPAPHRSESCPVTPNAKGDRGGSTAPQRDFTISECVLSGIKVTQVTWPWQKATGKSMAWCVNSSAITWGLCSYFQEQVHNQGAATH